MTVRSEDGHPVDALSVGHYINVKPQEAELALDQAISRVLSGKVEEPDGGSAVDLPDADLLLTQYFERGIIPGCQRLESCGFGFSTASSASMER